MKLRGKSNENINIEVNSLECINILESEWMSKMSGSNSAYINDNNWIIDWLSESRDDIKKDILRPVNQEELEVYSAFQKIKKSIQDYNDR